MRFAADKREMITSHALQALAEGMGFAEVPRPAGTVSFSTYVDIDLIRKQYTLLHFTQRFLLKMTKSF